MLSPQRLTWLKERQTGIGGSDIGAIVGVSTFHTAVDVYLDKLASEEELFERERQYEDGDAAERRRWGHAIEPLIVKEFERRHKVIVICPGTVIVRNPVKPWMFVTVDGQFADPENSNAATLLECKNVDSMMARKFWGDEGTDQAPPLYVAQVQWAMRIKRYKRAIIAVLIGGNEYREYVVNADEEIQDELEQKAAGFWTHNVLKKIPPAPTNLDDVKRLTRRVHGGKALVAGESIQADLRAFAQGKDAQKHSADVSDAIEMRLRSFMGDADTLFDISGNNIIATLKEQSRTGIDTKLLEAKYPEAYQDCLTESKFRVLRLKKEK